MPEINPKNAQRWVNSYFDSPHTVHLGFGALGAVAMWTIGALDVAFSKPPMWVYLAAGAGVSGLTYAIDICASSLYQIIAADE